MVSGLRKLAVAAAAFQIVALGSPPAGASMATESYVAQNAAQAMNALTAASADERSAKFGALMDQFADMSAISDFVLGSYGRGLSTDPALKTIWNTAFRNYAMASYQNHFDHFRGTALRVTGSRDYLQNGKSCSRVATEMASKQGEPMAIIWYLCSGPSGWKVNDVGLAKGGSEVKLAIMQRDQMVAFLGANGGDVHKLIARLDQQAAVMNKRA